MTTGRTVSNHSLILTVNCETKQSQAVLSVKYEFDQLQKNISSCNYYWFNIQGESVYTSSTPEFYKVSNNLMADLWDQNNMI